MNKAKYTVIAARFNGDAFKLLPGTELGYIIYYI